jgi:hypothetical protein
LEDECPAIGYTLSLLLVAAGDNAFGKYSRGRELGAAPASSKELKQSEEHISGLI